MNDNFIFYQTFWEAYLNLLGKQDESGQYEEENQKKAYKFLDAICRYGIEGTYEKGDPLLDALMVSVVFGIDRAADRYIQAIENGKKGGAPLKYDKKAIVDFVNRGHTQQEAADLYGSNIRTDRRDMQESREELKSIINKDGSYNF